MIKALLEPPFLPQNKTLKIGGSKSESNRLLILQALYPNINIKNISDADDTLLLQKGLQTQKTVDVGHAGTAMRFLTAYFATLENSETLLTGSERMHQRPIGVLVKALRELGAKIDYVEKEGFPPLKIYGRKIEKNQLQINAGISSQYISALLLIAPKLPNGLTLELVGEITSEPYIRLTLSLLNKIGIQTRFANNKITVFPKSKIEDCTVYVESDWSSLSYFYSLAALSEEKSIEFKFNYFSENSFQGDRNISSYYKKLGIQTLFEEESQTVILRKNDHVLPKKAFFSLNDSPDLAQTIAVTCFGLGMGCKIDGLHTLKIKETDRLIALKNELEKLGANVKITADSLEFDLCEKINSHIEVETYQDHRMAMAFAPLGIKVPIRIRDAEVVSKSYPLFWEHFQRLGMRCELRED